MSEHRSAEGREERSELGDERSREEPGLQMSNALLQARGLTRRFGAFTAVDGVDLDVAEGSIHSIIGPNGAGKTTLFRLLTGLLRPTSGNAVLRRHEHRRQSPACHRPAWARPVLPADDDLPAAHGARIRAGRDHRPGTSHPRSGQLVPPHERARRPARARSRGPGSDGRPVRRAPSRTATSGPSTWHWRWRSVRGCCCSTSRRPACRRARPDARSS